MASWKFVKFIYYQFTTMCNLKFIDVNSQESA